MQVSYEAIVIQNANRTKVLANQINVEQAEIEAQESELELLVTTIADYDSDLALKENNKADKQSEINDLLDELNPLLERQSQLTIEIQEIDENRSDLLEVLATLNQELAENNARIESLLAEIEEITSSVSRESKIAQAKINVGSLVKLNNGRCQAESSEGSLVTCFLGNKEDIIRINHQELLAKGVDLRGVPKDSIGVKATDLDSVPYHVEANDLFDENSFIEVLTEAYDSIYTDSRMYQVFVNFDEPMETASGIGNMSATINPASAAQYTVSVSNNNQYSHNTRLNGGWHDPEAYTSVYSNYTSEMTFNFEVDANAVLTNASSLLLKTAYSIWKFDSLNISVKINGTAIPNSFPVMQGRDEIDLSLSIPANNLIVGNNELTIGVSKSGPGSRGSFEMGGFDVSYNRLAVLGDEQLSLTKIRSFIV